jgi:hypothetical protein
MIKICQWCAQPFYIKDSHAHTRVRCSKACMAEEYRVSMRGSNNPNFRNAGQYVCPHCQQPFQSYTKGRKYCSKACYDEVRRLTARPRHIRSRRPVQLRLLYRAPATPRKRVKRRCLLCQRPFFARKGSQVYCPDCGYVTVQCVVCSTTFRKHRTHVRQTCSLTCSRQWLSLRQQGEKSHRWQGGKTAASILRRTHVTYKTWRHTVFARDDYTCAMCRMRGGKLAAHHIFRVKDTPELIYEVSNGITLCWECHRSIHWKEAAYAPKFLAFLVGHLPCVSEESTP